jgi:hypothetical protein
MLGFWVAVASSFLSGGFMARERNIIEQAPRDFLSPIEREIDIIPKRAIRTGFY